MTPRTDIESWRNYCLKCARNHTLPAWYDAEDLAQDALERLVRDYPHFDQARGSLETFIKFRIRSAMIDKIRWLWRHKVEYVPYYIERDMRSYDPQSMYDSAIMVYQAWPSLSKRQRARMYNIYWQFGPTAQHHATHIKSLSVMAQALGG